MIQRNATEYVTRMAKSFPVVSITGPRQSGKTTLARTMFPDYEYLNLENPDTMHEATADGASFFRNHPTPLILDEVQRMPELLSRIQVMVDAKPSQKGMFILTGSQQPRLKEGLSQSLAGRAGQLVNCQSIANDIGVSVPTVKNWISVLEACFIITTLPCYYRNFGKRFVKAPKIYFTDVGMLTHLLGIREESQIVRDPLFGAIFENMVVMEAFKAKLNRGLPPDLYFIRDRSGTEVDLVAEQGRKLHLFEIKASASYSADFTKNMDKLAKDIPDIASRNVIYSGDDLPNGKTAGYFNFKSIERLMKDLSLL